jgi:hypothetical protein
MRHLPDLRLVSQTLILDETLLVGAALVVAGTLAAHAPGRAGVAGTGTAAPAQDADPRRGAWTTSSTRFVRFHYARLGSGDPVPLVPGSGGWRLNFTALIEDLARPVLVRADPRQDLQRNRPFR